MIYVIQPIEKKKYSINYESELNPEQLRVVMTDTGALLVIAGAGSGKTRAITYRVARLIEGGISPDRILLMTFTNKAAKEMLSRVKDLVRVRTSDIWGGTFHSIANRVLRQYAAFVGYDRGFTILDQDDSFQIINSCIEEMGFDTKNGNFPKGRIIAGLHSYARNTDAHLDALIDKKHRHFQSFKGRILDVTDLYEKRKRKQNVMDFDDLLLNLRHLLQTSPVVREQLTKKFMHVLVDEFQDTNSVQSDIVELLSGQARSVMCVGDDFQSIYSFRGAVFENIMGFSKRFPEAKIFYLERNYRSTPEIVRLANESIAVNANQYKKNLVSMHGAGMRPRFAQTYDSAGQAQYVAENIQALIAEGIPPESIAVLYRAHFHSMEVQMELTRRRVPFVVRSGLGFFDAAHVKDVTAFLRLLCNPQDELSWKRLFLLSAGIGKVSAEKIWKKIAEADDSLATFVSKEFMAAVPKKAVNSISWMRDAVRKAVQSDCQPTRLINVFVEEGYGDYLQGEYENYEDRRDDLQELAVFAGKYQKLEDFLAEMALMTTAEETVEEESGKVVLTTIHQSKGLEWNSVFLIWCADGMFPNARSLEEDPRGEEEERRLFYVAVTRAQERLFLCAPMYDFRRGGGYLDVSRFINEISEEKQPLFDPIKIEPVSEY